MVSNQVYLYVMEDLQTSQLSKRVTAVMEHIIHLSKTRVINTKLLSLGWLILFKFQYILKYRLFLLSYSNLLDYNQSLLFHYPVYGKLYMDACFFVSTIAWDLLPVNVYGIQAFRKWFLETYPSYFISPLRLSGSAVESLFNQYRFSARGKLDSVNFTTAHAAHLVKQCAASHHSDKSYRDESFKLYRNIFTKISYNKQTLFIIA